MDQGSKVEESSFCLMYGLSQTYFFDRVPTRSLDLLFFVVSGTFAIRQPGPWRQKRPFEAMFSRFRQMWVFWKTQDPPRRFHEATPGRQIILTVCEATSGATSASVADLKAAPEVDKTKSIYY